jgi:hypothetical protein
MLKHLLFYRLCKYRLSGNYTKAISRHLWRACCRPRSWQCELPLQRCYIRQLNIFARNSQYFDAAVFICVPFKMRVRPHLREHFTLCSQKYSSVGRHIISVCYRNMREGISLSGRVVGRWFGRSRDMKRAYKTVLLCKWGVAEWM